MQTERELRILRTTVICEDNYEYHGQRSFNEGLAHNKADLRRSRGSV